MLKRWREATALAVVLTISPETQGAGAERGALPVQPRSAAAKVAQVPVDAGVAPVPFPDEFEIPAMPERIVAPQVEEFVLPEPTLTPGYAPLAPVAPAVGLTVIRRHLPHPDPTEHPRKSIIEVFAPAGSIVTRNGKPMDAVLGKPGVFRYAPKDELLPGVPYLQHIQVESYTPAGVAVSRTYSLYMRMGLLTELTFKH